jgi:hypothetical protein
LLKIKGLENDVERFPNQGCRGGGVVRTGGLWLNFMGNITIKVATVSSTFVGC